jgi:hypothetical protein
VCGEGKNKVYTVVVGVQFLLPAGQAYYTLITDWNEGRRGLVFVNVECPNHFRNNFCSSKEGEGSSYSHIIIIPLDGNFCAKTQIV